MERNLSGRERKIRVGAAVFLAGLAGGLYGLYHNVYLTVALLLASAGFLINYFTRFCGVKKAVNEMKKRF